MVKNKEISFQNLKEQNLIIGSYVHLQQNQKLIKLATKNNTLIYWVDPNNISKVLQFLG